MITIEAPRSAEGWDTVASRDILGVSVLDSGRKTALDIMHRAIAAHRHVKLAFCNAHTANTAWRDHVFQHALQGFTVLPDGIGVDMAARWLSGRPFEANLNGTDFVPALLASSPTPLRVAMIGGKPGVAERAARSLSLQDPRHSFGPTLHGFADAAATGAWLDTLVKSPVDVILVAMGNPTQELWISENVTSAHGTIAIGVGALFDFAAGDVSRAPEFVRKLRLEWAYRLAQEPRRLFKRYIVGNPLFIMRVLAVKLGIAAR
jgi:exopolysaccharide biosynthesis WecB/TagA/CpsF family protein